MPSRKEIQWSQLRVGALVLTAMAILVVLILLMSSAGGGLFARKLVLRSYFENAAGLKDGAPVTLEGVTIGNVIHVRVVPERNPTPVEVKMRVGYEYARASCTPIRRPPSTRPAFWATAMSISVQPMPAGPLQPNNAELKAGGSPSIQDVVRNSNESIIQINKLLHKLEPTIDAINSRHGLVGELINDPELARKVSLIATNLQTITGAVANGQGSLGKLINDDTLYTRANDAVDRLNKITIALDEGKGSAGKFLKDDALYNNLNAAANNTNQLVAEINAGKGTLGLLAKDPAFAAKLDDTVIRLDGILENLDDGKGTLGQLMQNRALYDHADQTLDQASQLVKAIREDPKKYLVIRMKIF